MIDTIYLGGGTPSQLSEENLHRLFSAIYNKVENDVSFQVSPNAEVTMECNPDDITPQFAQTIAKLPINRVSMGVQTFDDVRLKFPTKNDTSLPKSHLRLNNFDRLA